MAAIFNQLSTGTGVAVDTGANVASDVTTANGAALIVAQPASAGLRILGATHLSLRTRKGPMTREELG